MTQRQMSAASGESLAFKLMHGCFGAAAARRTAGMSAVVERIVESVVVAAASSCGFGVLPSEFRPPAGALAGWTTRSRNSGKLFSGSKGPALRASHPHVLSIAEQSLLERLANPLDGPLDRVHHAFIVLVDQVPDLRVAARPGGHAGE